MLIGSKIKKRGREKSIRIQSVGCGAQDVRGEKEENRDSKGGRPLSVPGNRSGRSIRLSIGLEVCQKERSFCRIESCQGKPQNLSRDKKLGSRAPRGEARRGAARRGEWPLPRIDCENVSRGLKRNTAASNQYSKRETWDRR